MTQFDTAITIEVEEPESSQSVATAIEIFIMRADEPISRHEFSSEVALDGIAPETLDSAWSIVQRRSRELGDKYHIDVSGRVLKPRTGKASSPYRALCLMGLSDVPFRRSRHYVATATLLDEIVEAIAPSFYGSNGCASVTSRKTAEDGRVSLQDRWKPIASALGTELDSSVFDPNANDAGVDVVLWWRRDVDDLNTPVILFQTTTSLSYRDKPRDVLPNQWKAALRLENVHGGFVTPLTVPEKWQKSITYSTSYIWHRPTLIKLFSSPSEFDPALLDKCEAFVGSQLSP